MKYGTNKYLGFLIDADNTIFDFQRAEREAFMKTCESLPSSEPASALYDKFTHINKNLWKVMEKKKISIEQLKTERFSILVRLLGIKADAGKLSETFLRELSKKTYMLPHAVEVLDFLSRRAMICLGTNGISIVQRGRISRAGIDIFFHDIIVSEEIGVSKPDPMFFARAAETLHLSPHEILCVGDSPSADIEGAHRAGFHTCWYIGTPCIYPADKIQPDYIISDLRELRDFAHEVS
ncbi:MAG: YjjG family noncanonical pyrimidine nucleotidase [Spirochaetales bacterium]|nr:YjjG family noncanonical pyrimidine nucleotidase [Spirochaetales bacterium]